MCIAKTTPSKPAINDIFVAEPTANNTSSKKKYTQMSQEMSFYQFSHHEYTACVFSNIVFDKIIRLIHHKE